MKYCKGCGKKYTKPLSFCENCGNKLVELVEKSSKSRESKKPSPKPDLFQSRNIVIGVVVLIVIIGLIGVNRQTGSFVSVQTTTTATPEKKCHDIQEPYTVQVPYQYAYKYSVADFKSFSESLNHSLPSLFFLNILCNFFSAATMSDTRSKITAFIFGFPALKS